MSKSVHNDSVKNTYRKEKQENKEMKLEDLKASKHEFKVYR